MVKRFDPLRNIRTSQVFFALLSGKTYPKRLSNYLNITPGAVMQHLYRLRTSGIVEYGEKNGRIQNYKIHWPNLVRIFLERAPVSVAISIRLKRSALENKYFETFIREYFRNFVMLVQEEGYRPSRGKLTKKPATILNVMDDFELGLRVAFPEVEKEKGGIKDEKSEEFWELMREWWKRTGYMTAPHAVRKAFEKTN